MSKLPAANPSPEAHTKNTLSPYIAFDDPKHHIRLYHHGDCLEPDLKLIRYDYNRPDRDTVVRRNPQ